MLLSILARNLNKQGGAGVGGTIRTRKANSQSLNCLRSRHRAAGRRAFPSLPAEVRSAVSGAWPPLRGADLKCHSVLRVVIVYLSVPVLFEPWQVQPAPDTPGEWLRKDWAVISPDSGV